MAKTTNKYDGEREAEQRATACIVDGCVSGELNCLNTQNNEEIRGWWERITMTVEEFLVKNRERNLYFRYLETGTLNVIFIPQGWGDEFTYANGFTGGPDWDKTNKKHLSQADGAEVYGYGPSKLISNDSKIETMFWKITDLQDEITEVEARQIHPNMFLYLDKID